MTPEQVRTYCAAACTCAPPQRTACRRCIFRSAPSPAGLELNCVVVFIRLLLSPFCVTLPWPGKSSALCCHKHTITLKIECFHCLCEFAQALCFAERPRQPITAPARSLAAAQDLAAARIHLFLHLPTCAPGNIPPRVLTAGRSFALARELPLPLLLICLLFLSTSPRSTYRLLAQQPVSWHLPAPSAA